jgi:3-phenylpropionate/trans-cinnamate dioxygenase ferredoxin reductase component
VSGVRRIVVLGNGIAGLTAAESLRDNGFDGELTIVGEEPHAPYSRPALSKAALLDDDPSALRLPGSTHGATELLGVTACSLDPDHRVVALSDGRTLLFDGLVIATGSRARHLSDPADAEAPEELTLRGLDDMVRLRSRLSHRPTVVVVGGGPLGMEIASGAIDAGCSVTLVELGRPLQRHLGTYLSDLVVDAAVLRGLDARTSGCLQVRRSGAGVEAVLGDGSVVTADLLVSAVGDLPNLEWLAGSGLLTDGQLLVDSRGRVVVDGQSRADIVAAGDVATFPTASGPRRVPLWTSAIDQAKVAAPALLRGDAAPELAFTPYFWTDQFGLNLRASGPCPPDGEPQIVDGDPAAGSALLRWDAPDHGPDGSGTAVAVSYRMPIPRLRRLAQQAPAPQPVAG